MTENQLDKDDIRDELHDLKTQLTADQIRFARKWLEEEERRRFDHVDRQRDILYAVVNKSPSEYFGSQSPLVLCGEDGADTDAIYEDEPKAFDVRNRLRDRFDNSDIAVFELRTKEITEPAGRGEGSP